MDPESIRDGFPVAEALACCRRPGDARYCHISGNAEIGNTTLNYDDDGANDWPPQMKFGRVSFDVTTTGRGR